MPGGEGGGCDAKKIAGSEWSSLFARFGGGVRGAGGCTVVPTSWPLGTFSSSCSSSLLIHSFTACGPDDTYKPPT